jgi:hypothetical protein
VTGLATRLTAISSQPTAPDACWLADDRRFLPAALRCKQRVNHRPSWPRPGFLHSPSTNVVWLAPPPCITPAFLARQSRSTRPSSLSHASAQPESSSGKTNILLYDIIPSRQFGQRIPVGATPSPHLSQISFDHSSHQDALQYTSKVVVIAVAWDPPANGLACSPLKLQIYPKCRSTATTTQKSEAIARRR